MNSSVDVVTISSTKEKLSSGSHKQPTLIIPTHRPSPSRDHRKQACFRIRKSPSFFELLNPTDLERLCALRRRMMVAYDEHNPKHISLLMQTWDCAFPGTLEHIRPVSRHWRLLGFQSSNPATDFRGAGVFALHAILYFANTEAELFKDIASNGRVYPFAASCISIVHILRFSLGLAEPHEVAPGYVGRIAPPTLVKSFARLFVAYEYIVEKLFCACVLLVERLWGLLISSRVRVVRKVGKPSSAPGPSLKLETRVVEVHSASTDTTTTSLAGMPDEVLDALLPKHSEPLTEHLQAILEFPRILAAVRGRLEAVLASAVGDSCTWMAVRERILERPEHAM